MVQTLRQVGHWSGSRVWLSECLTRAGAVQVHHKQKAQNQQRAQKHGQQGQPLVAAQPAQPSRCCRVAVALCVQGRPPICDMCAADTGNSSYWAPHTAHVCIQHTTPAVQQPHRKGKHQRKGKLNANTRHGQGRNKCKQATGPHPARTHLSRVRR